MLKEGEDLVTLKIMITRLLIELNRKGKYEKWGKILRREEVDYSLKIMSIRVLTESERTGDYFK